MKHRASNLIWGLAFIALGVIFLGNTFWNFQISVWSIIGCWWPLLILIPSLAGIFDRGFRFGNMLGIVIGGILLLFTNNLVSFSQIRGLIVPIILILIGLSILFKDILVKKPSQEAYQKMTNSASAEYSAIFSSNNVIYPHDVFNGTSINSVFGSVVLNLRDAIVTEDVVINATVIFAGADIYVPGNVNVKVSSVPIFGGVSNKVQNLNGADAPTIYINATCMFGGVDIK